MSWELELKSAGISFRNSIVTGDTGIFRVSLFSLPLFRSFSHFPKREDFQEKREEQIFINVVSLGVSGIRSERKRGEGIQPVIRKSRVYLQDYRFRSLRSRRADFFSSTSERSTTWKFFYSYVSRFEKENDRVLVRADGCYLAINRPPLSFSRVIQSPDFLAHLKHLSIEHLLSLNLFFTFLWYLPVKMVVERWRENTSPCALFNLFIEAFLHVLPFQSEYLLLCFRITQCYTSEDDRWHSSLNSRRRMFNFMFLDLSKCFITFLLFLEFGNWVSLAAKYSFFFFFTFFSLLMKVIVEHII